MSAPQTKVSVFRRDELVHEQVLSPGKYIIGQGSDAEIRLQAAGVASHHARLDLGQSEWQIEDLESGTGTFLDDLAVNKPTTFQREQRIRLGEFHLVLDILPEPGAASGEVKVVRAWPVEKRDARRYSLGRTVAHGGMGFIKNAHEPALQREVAMKVMRDPSKPGAQDRFFQEAQITAQLEHPNIVPVHELGVDEEGKPYYTMKLVRGISLKRVLELLSDDDAATVRQWPLSALLTVFQKICDALAFAHSKNVIHRDLKPANIMLGEYGEALVMDWGLAKVLGRESTHTAPVKPLAEADTEAPPDADATTIGPTISGTVMGTPQYMSPEQANGEVEMMDQRTDIYSLGAILYHLLTLRPPFHGRSSAEVMQNVRAGRIVPFAEACGKKRRAHLPGGRLPESLGAVILKAMSLDRSHRYPTVKALQVELEAYQSGFATSAENAGTWKLVSLFLRRNRAASIAAALLLLSGVVFAINLVRAYHRAEEATGSAVAARVVADEQRNAAENQLYLSEMLQAGRHLSDGRPENARQLLDRHRSEPSGRDLRDWEWFYLSGQASQDRLRVNAHPGGVLALSPSSDGARVASAGADGEIAIWQTRGLVPQWRLQAHPGPIHTVSWQPGGKLLASGGADGFVRVWDLETHKNVAEMRVGTGQAVRAVAWRPSDGGVPTLAIGGLEKEILLWRPMASGEEGRAETLASTKNGVAGLSWSKDGQRLAAAEIDTGDTLEVFNATTHEKILSTTAAAGTDVFAVAIDPSGKFAAVGSKHLTVSIFDLDSKQRKFSAALHHGFVSALAWSPDGHYLASASHDATIRVIAPKDDPDTSQVLNGHTGAVNALAWLKLPAQDGNSETTALFSGGSDGTLRAWLPASVEDTTLTVKPHNWIGGAQWDPHGSRIAIVNFRDHVHLADPISGLNIPLCSRHGNLYDVAWSPDGSRVATASRGSGQVEILDTTTGRLLAVQALPNAVRVAWSKSGRYLAGAGTEETRIWDTVNGALVSTILRPTKSLAWHPDEQRIALGGNDGAVQLWDAFSGKQLATWKSAAPAVAGSVTSQHEPPHAIFDLRWSPDTRYLAYATQDGLAGLLESGKGQLVREFPGHSSGVWRLAWSPSGTRLATVGQDGIIRLFATDSGRQVAQITHGSGSSELQALDWSPDGREVLSGGFDHDVRIRDAQRGSLIDAIDQLTEQIKAQPNDLETLRKLALTYAQLGWVDEARLTFGLVHGLAPDDPATRTAAADGETAFARALDTASSDWISSPALLGERRRSLELLTTVHDQWEAGETESALTAYRELVHLSNAAPLLAFASTYLGRAHWTATWFPSKADPLQDLAAWRGQAKGPDAITAGVRALDFPYQKGGPKALILNQDLTERGPGPAHFGMIAHAKIKLPAGKWRLHASGAGGVRILADQKVVLENWTADAPAEKSADYENTTTGEVEFTIEHFVLDPTPSFTFLVDPLVP